MKKLICIIAVIVITVTVIYASVSEEKKTGKSHWYLVVIVPSSTLLERLSMIIIHILLQISIYFVKLT